MKVQILCIQTHHGDSANSRLFVFGLSALSGNVCVVCGQDDHERRNGCVIKIQLSLSSPRSLRDFRYTVTENRNVITLLGVRFLFQSHAMKTIMKEPISRYRDGAQDGRERKNEL